MGSVARDVSIKLGDRWTFYFDNGPPRGISKPVWEEYVKELGTFGTIQSFWRYWNTIMKRLPLPDYSNLRLFKEGIKPLWEDPANKQGGKWTIPCPKDLSIETWSEVVFAVIGEQLEDKGEICGLVLAVRPKGDNIHIWHRNAESPNKDHITSRLQNFVPFDELKPLLSYVPHTVSQDYMQRDVQKVQDKKSKGGKNKKRQTVDSPSKLGHHDEATVTLTARAEDAASVMKRDWGSRDIFDAALRERRAWGSMDLARHSHGPKGGLTRTVSANKLAGMHDESKTPKRNALPARQWGSVDSRAIVLGTAPSVREEKEVHKGETDPAPIIPEPASAQSNADHVTVPQEEVQVSGATEKSKEQTKERQMEQATVSSVDIKKPERVEKQDRSSPQEVDKREDIDLSDPSIAKSTLLTEKDMLILEQLDKEMTRKRREHRKKLDESSAVDLEERTRQLQNQIYIAGALCFILALALIFALFFR